MEQFKSLDEKYAKSILLYLLKKGEVLQKDLSHIVKNLRSLKQILDSLEDDGLITITEKIIGRRAYYISLTDKGRVVAEQLRNAEKLAKLTPEEIERFKRMRALIHVNVYEDHITIMDIGWEDERVVNIYARPKGDVVYFWCDVDEDTDCYHIQYMFANPKLSDFVRGWIEKNGFKLAKIYQKYVDKYWA